MPDKKRAVAVAKKEITESQEELAYIVGYANYDGECVSWLRYKKSCPIDRGIYKHWDEVRGKNRRRAKVLVKWIEFNRRVIEALKAERKGK